MIDFISAKDGGIQMFTNNGIAGFAKSAKSIAYVMQTKGVADTVYGSSNAIIKSKLKLRREQ